jgi:hypothetical protein
MSAARPTLLVADLLRIEFELRHRLLRFPPAVGVAHPMKPERTPRRVVFPDPVPPDTITFARPRTHAERNRIILGPSALEPHEVLQCERHEGELPDGERWTAERKGRDDRMRRSAGRAGRQARNVLS